MSDYIIRATNIKKYFGGVKALDGVNLEIKKGEIHCLAGENGCGKSTIINIISGFYTPDSGTIEIDGIQHEKMNPKQAIANGIQVIYQDLSLFPNLTVMENLAINMEVAAGRKFVSKARMRKIAEEAVAKIGFEIDLDETVENLTVGMRQMIAISRALLNDAKLIIMDEPTTAITKREVKALFKIIKQLQAQGIAVLFVSHKLDEVFEIAERFTIFRSGKNVAEGNTKELDQNKFTYYMTGREIVSSRYEYTSEDAPTVLEVKNLSLNNGFMDVSFCLKQGEIVGITGLLGSGRTELAETLFGYHAADSGEILIEGKPVEIRSIKQGIENGIGYLPSDRVTEGLFLSQSVADNISIEKWNDYANCLGKINRMKVQEMAAYWAKELSIAVHNLEDPVGTLSGGNQQKCVLAKWLALDLKVLILNGPTVGVDIGAKFDIYQLVKRLAKQGLTVFIISDDLPEVLTNCNRVMVMQSGRLVEILSTQGLEESRLAELAH
ncbi:sugar ABC transporter ATP-binding protein [Sporomusa acidovorans]|uniref:Ribose import ATP-binding protein RbsA n=1 Tax=Sporomusa acidovorans (strain ATCC 49682 / DSM 3132 / Mol) TaxID=1123286 RepID=A0ABZ3JA46_SPOA4|nr:sugar ABC transporter ATP-binding protein [Sporomusa acidovorans]OZC17370.1 ribose import ATP-binding protein RbsA [Sporomusa acidovorans DSM 3132]SDF67889.1 monosaccharide ABC transporter ATP-binding protein, CUT2 family [Sporomusa acidovorans]